MQGSAARQIRQHHPDLEARFACGGCRADVRSLGEYAYVLRPLVWRETCGRKAMLCVGCAERRLGRPLTWHDFDWRVPLNTLDDMGPRSPRLLAAMLRDAPEMGRRPSPG